MRASVVAAGTAAAAWSLPAAAPLAPALSRALRIQRRLEAGEPAVALTFDDGPHPEGTPAVIRALERRAARATFFLVGEQVDRHPGLAREIAAAGHAVALHGYRHRNLLRVTPRSLADDLDRAFDSVCRATGVEPTHYRPPYGIFSSVGLAQARSRGWKLLLWSRWGHDWRRRATPAGIASELTDRVGAGDVLLLHDADHYSASDSWRSTAAALPRVLDVLADRGLRTITVSSDAAPASSKSQPTERQAEG